MKHLRRRMHGEEIKGHYSWSTPSLLNGLLNVQYVICELRPKFQILLLQI